MTIRPAVYGDADAVVALLGDLAEGRAPEKALRSTAVKCIKAGHLSKNRCWCFVSEERGAVDGVLYAEKQFVLDLVPTMWSVHVIYLAGRHRAKHLLRHLRETVRGRILIAQHVHWCSMEAFDKFLGSDATRVGGIWEL